MHFRQTRLVKPAAAVCGSVMALAMLTAPAAAAVEEEEPIVRTEEDYARGKQNVRSVIEELTELFTNDNPVSVVQYTSQQILPPYSILAQRSRPKLSVPRICSLHGYIKLSFGF